jgi:hypothetical protein
MWFSPYLTVFHFKKRQETVNNSVHDLEITYMSKPICLFVYGLCNDVVSNSDYTESNGKMILNGKLERLREEAVVT